MTVYHHSTEIVKDPYGIVHLWACDEHDLTPVRSLRMGSYTDFINLRRENERFSIYVIGGYRKAHIMDLSKRQWQALVDEACSIIRADYQQERIVEADLRALLTEQQQFVKEWTRESMLRT